jgi:LPS-assembly lipoprotein
MVRRWLGNMPLIALACLAGCGFHLRGDTQLSPQLEPTYLEGISPYSQLGIELKRSLEANGVAVIEEPAQASAILRITYNQLQQQVLSVGAAGKVQEYALRYLLQFQVIDSEGKVLLPLQHLELVREYRFDERSVISAAEQEILLGEALVVEMVQQMLWRLEALSSSLSG